MPDQVALTGTGFGKDTDPVKERNRWRHRCQWCWVEISRKTMTVRQLRSATS